MSVSLLRLAYFISLSVSTLGSPLSSRAPSGTKGMHDHKQMMILLAHVVISVKDVIIQMFEWSWDSIASECTNFIGPAGKSRSRYETSQTDGLVSRIGYGFVQGFSNPKTLVCVETNVNIASPAQEHIQGALLDPLL